MDLSRFSMEGRTVIITGGSGGIGRGCARAFASAGANIVIASVPADSIPPALEEIEKLGSQALGISVNVAEPLELDRMVGETLQRFGRIDALINVAGGSYSRNPDMPQYKRSSLSEMDGEDFVGAYVGNVKTAFLASRAVIPHLQKSGKGSITNIGSIAGLDRKPSSPDIAAYGTAKAAVHSLTVHMAHQWGPQVRVNCIAPGTIDTPRPEGTVRPEMAQAAQRIAVGRVGVGDDIGSVALFLASDAAGFVNGIVIPVHGGE
ncbi:MAG: SDR family oxidoreductase [Dehalococcoidia bacterium]|nr:SDR family oxidoreductase [Dehalococcoidia bacterium]HCH35196.1 hypothetical protein [Dehalococcoidia bacterium]